MQILYVQGLIIPARSFYVHGSVNAQADVFTSAK